MRLDEALRSGKDFESKSRRIIYRDGDLVDIHGIRRKALFVPCDTTATDYELIRETFDGPEAMRRALAGAVVVREISEGGNRWLRIKDNRFEIKGDADQDWKNNAFYNSDLAATNWFQVTP